ncbi:apolipoprotein D-like [Rhodnius prolixus]|uniref:apolipoprotein D-like n=1 Tax=Rhodnius prolixus TaxID=13249 RepID=UPI003D18A82A
MKELILIICTLTIAISRAQMPGFGWCPDKRAMPGFDIDKYLGTWYEAERYFTVLEAGSRCARTNYTKAVDGRILVTNEITNRLTGIKRVLDGEIRNVPKGGVDSKISVKYSTLPFPMETEYIILDTDYDSYAVVWSCSGFGPLVNTQTAWVMTRERLPPGIVLQKAYAVLDKNKISRTFFVRAEQEECNLGEALSEKSRASDAANQNVESATTSASAVNSSFHHPSVAPVETSSTGNEVYMPQKKVEGSVSSPEAVGVNSESSNNAEETVRPDSNDSSRKPAPAVTAGPPALSSQHAVVSGSNSVVSEQTKPTVSTSEAMELKN